MLKLDELISVIPSGIEVQVAVALIVYGLLLLFHAGGPLSLKALQRQIKTALNEAIYAAGFAAGVAARDRRARARPAASAPTPLLRQEPG